MGAKERIKEFPIIGRAAQGKLYLGFLVIGFLLWRVCTHLVLGGIEFFFGLLASGAACGLGLLSVDLCQRSNGASILSRAGPKAAFVQLVQRKKIT